jgi:hypothetical protein
MVFLGVAFIVFDLQYFLMASLPGTRNNMCVDGGNLTPINIIFSIFLSLLVGLMIVNLIALFLMQASKNKAALTSATGVGMGLGALTLFCPICALPVISVFGLSIGLEFINDFNLWLKLLSIAMIIVSLIMVNGRLDKDCKACAYGKNTI